MNVRGISHGLNDISDGDAFQISPFFQTSTSYSTLLHEGFFQGCHKKSHILQSSRYPCEKKFI